MNNLINTEQKLFQNTLPLDPYLITNVTPINNHTPSLALFVQRYSLARHHVPTPTDPPCNFLYCRGSPVFSLIPLGIINFPERATLRMRERARENRCQLSPRVQIGAERRSALLLVFQSFPGKYRGKRAGMNVEWNKWSDWGGEKERRDLLLNLICVG